MSGRVAHCYRRNPRPSRPGISSFGSVERAWTSFPATPRFGTTYFGLRNRLSVLTEAYSYAPFKDRVLVTRDFCRALLEFAGAHRDEPRTCAVVDLPFATYSRP